MLTCELKETRTTIVGDLITMAEQDIDFFDGFGTYAVLPRLVTPPPLPIFLLFLQLKMC
jgi:hypothetical protein